MSDERLELIVDSNDLYLDSTNVFYMHPQRLATLQCVENNQFSSATIKNSSIEHLSSINFSYILKKLKVQAVCEIIIHQPITVMQEYDAKQVEANAKLAGFSNIETTQVETVDPKTDKKIKTLAVTCTKPVKAENDKEIQLQFQRKSSIVKSPKAKTSNLSPVSKKLDTKNSKVIVTSTANITVNRK